MKTVWRVFAYLKRYPWLAAGTLACAIMGTLMVIVFPSVTKWIIEDVVRANRPDKLLPLILLAAVAFLVHHLFNSLRIILNNTFEQKVIFDLRSDLYSHIQLLPLRWFDNRATGDLMTRVIEDVNSVERVLIDGIEQGVRLHAHGAPAISITAARCVEYQCAVARQSCRCSSDQKLRARTRRTRAFQPRQRSTPARHAGGDADMGDLLAIDVDV